MLHLINHLFIEFFIEPSDNFIKKYSPNKDGDMINTKTGNDFILSMLKKEIATDMYTNSHVNTNIPLESILFFEKSIKKVINNKNTKIIKVKILKICLNFIIEIMQKIILTIT